MNLTNQEREPIRTCRSTVRAENLVHLFDGHHNLIVIKLNQHRSVVRSISHCKSVMYAIFKSFITHFPSNLRLCLHVFARCFFFTLFMLLLLLWILFVYCLLLLKWLKRQRYYDADDDNNNGIYLFIVALTLDCFVNWKFHNLISRICCISDSVSSVA